MKKNNFPKSFLSFFVLYCLFINFNSQLALCQTVDPTPSPSPDTTAAAKPSATPLDGDTTLENVKIESEIMGYRALKSAAGEISRDVIAKKGAAQNLAILNSQWLIGIRSYWSTKYQLKLIKEGYDSVLVRQTAPLAEINMKKRPTGLLAKLITKDKGFAKSLGVKKTNHIQSLSYSTPTAHLAMMPEESETAGISSGGNKFIGAATAIGSYFGLAGSIVGAFVDATALMRTDTKIVGSNFTVQESAFVSEVYRGLSQNGTYSNLLYPGEFPPNINIHDKFVILNDIQEVYKDKSRAEQLVTEIEEVEKLYKESMTEKDSLEARGKEIVKLLAAEQKELKKNNEIWKTKKFRTAELQAKIKDSENKIEALKKEQEVELPKKVESNKNAIQDTDRRLTQLYQQIKLEQSPIDLVAATVNVGESLDKISGDFLGRSYKLEELEQLTADDKEFNENLVKEAEAFKRTKLTETQKDRLLNPLESGRLEIFIKIANRIKEDEQSFNQDVLNELLSANEQLKLFYPQEAQMTLGRRLYDRRKIASINRLKILNKQYDKFFEDIIKVDAALGVNPITTHLQTESLLNRLGCQPASGECPEASALVLKVIDVGGNNRTKKNLVTMIATGDNISHSGGAIVEYKLYDMTGNVVTSNVCTAYETYRKPQNIIKPSDQNTVVCTAVVNDSEQARTRKIGLP